MVLTSGQLTTVAEDIEHFGQWWEHSDQVFGTEIRHGSASLRRLLVEDIGGTAWRQMGFFKSPSLQGPDLLAFFHKNGIETDLVINANAGGARYAGVDSAFFTVYRVDHPSTGVSARADTGFGVAVSHTARKAEGAEPSELDALMERHWYVHEYLDAPGIIRKGQVLSRREVLKHMANEMGGVHVGKNLSESRELLVEAENKLLMDTPQGSLRTYHLEILAMGQAVGRSQDFRHLAHAIRLASAPQST